MNRIVITILSTFLQLGPIYDVLGYRPYDGPHFSFGKSRNANRFNNKVSVGFPDDT